MRDRYSGEQSSELGDSFRTIMDRKDIIIRVSDFIENEARSCSMDFGCVTPEYVYRMWGGQVPLKEIESAMTDVRRMIFDEGNRHVLFR